MEIEVKTAGKYKYIEEGEGEVLVLLHGLFGALSNWESVLERFSKKYKVIIPFMPIYDMPMRKAGLKELVKFVENFVEEKGLGQFTLIGNSLGGHVALMYTLKHPDKVKAMALTGSSGLFENSMGGSYPKRGSYEYIKERVEYTFYDPKTATKEYVDEVFKITKSIPKCMNIVAIAKSAQRNNLAGDLPNIKIPTLLIWGLNDTITPPAVAYEFDRLLPNSTLRFIDKCCHAPMMEQPEAFNDYLDEFLTNTI
ncbi:alpha/beta fold hydrolase [Aureibacter tunicatorum]|uniref:Pimeloyl-ACP methyl ester carboxylesterase n=1 Tax=Aureibacter tunicatorum TaxID=866807 RepID=A0AAE3XJK0_9BACT|nr:alpha/beta hydrolase [Aureibacter tunicatorum]MDR6238067.1 pimeloyl-ACP methyl ester carboxylesterase [Aureibacter tunicatorum]BDD03100.1 alpha/beta hydrolase [Aureibacter tunicatorum]